MRIAVPAAFAAGLMLAGAALAQPSGGPDAKGNAPLKAPHTVDDGSAKPGASSFTQEQARRHIERAGFGAVTGLNKGDDGVWRGQAVRNGAPVSVAMDFKGNVSTTPPPMPSGRTAGPRTRSATTTTTTRTTGAPPPLEPPLVEPSRTAPSMAGPASDVGAPAPGHHRRHRRHMHRHHRCAHPGPNGAACSGVDRNQNGISDREDHAIGQGARP